jgi:predicted nucleic acid-binding protein
MASKIFFDANLLLDLTLKRDHYREAEAIFDLVISDRVRAFTTSSVIHITGHYLTKFYGSDKAKTLLLAILANVNIIDISHEIAVIALSSKFSDIEDSLQYYTAIHHKLHCFISRDKKLQKDSLPILPVFTPREFLNEYDG